MMVKICLAALLALIALTQQVAGVTYGYEDPSKNLVKNWGFENPISSNDWTMAGGTGTKVAGGHTGGSALKVTNRNVKTDGPIQYIKGIKPNTAYYFSTHIKLLNPPSTGNWVRVTVLPKGHYSASSSKTLRGGVLTYIVQDNEWLQVGADFRTPGQQFQYIKYQIQVDPPNVKYLIDSVSLIELKKPSNWKTLLNQKINSIRKNQLKITGSLSGNLDLSKTTVTVELKRHEFGFGTALKADAFNKNQATNLAYKDFILNKAKYNWAVFENDMKWKPMEKTKGTIKYDRVDTALKVLKDHDMVVRGHALLWDVDKTNPAWVLPLKGTALKNEANRRVDYMMKRYGDDIYEWDVMNECLHQRFFEDNINNVEILEHYFRRAYSLKPGTRLCLNDFEIARGSGVLASANTNLAKRLLKRNVPLHCIGIQSHLKVKEGDANPEQLQQRLDIAGAAGLDMSITELSFHTTSVTERANALDTVYRVYFADPRIKDVIQWGFTDQFNPFATDFALTQGPSFTPNAAGQTYLNLVNKEWHTKLNIKPASRSVSKTIQAFRGKYQLKVVSAGKVLVDKEFYVKNTNNAINFSA